MNFNIKLQTALSTINEAQHSGTVEAAIDEYMDRYGFHRGQVHTHIINDLLQHHLPITNPPSPNHEYVKTFIDQLTTRLQANLENLITLNGREADDYVAVYIIYPTRTTISMIKHYGLPHGSTEQDNHPTVKELTDLLNDIEHARRTIYSIPPQ